jgi:hypothetical protein
MVLLLPKISGLFMGFGFEQRRGMLREWPLFLQRRVRLDLPMSLLTCTNLSRPNPRSGDGATVASPSRLPQAVLWVPSSEVAVAHAWSGYALTVLQVFLDEKVFAEAREQSGLVWVPRVSSQLWK